jgi:opacity protein-like surface antigen
MKKNIVVAMLIAGSCISMSAFSQGKNFEGYSVALNASSSSSNTERNTAGLLENFGDSPQNFILQAAYGLPMGGSGVFGLGGTYTLADFNAGPIKGKDRYSLYLEPGLMANDSTLIYGKASYINMKGEVAAGSANFDGLGYGLGLRIAFGKTAFWQLEFTQSDYNSKNIAGITYKPTSFNRTLGIGYRF